MGKTALILTLLQLLLLLFPITSPVISVQGVEVQSEILNSVILTHTDQIDMHYNPETQEGLIVTSDLQNGFYDLELLWFDSTFSIIEDQEFSIYTSSPGDRLTSAFRSSSNSIILSPSPETDIRVLNIKDYEEESRSSAIQLPLLPPITELFDQEPQEYSMAHGITGTDYSIQHNQLVYVAQIIVDAAKFSSPRFFQGQYFFGRTYIYDFKSTSWQELTDSPTDEWGTGVFAFSDSLSKGIYLNLFQEYRESTQQNRTHIFDLGAQKWSVVSTPTFPPNFVGYDLLYHEDMGRFLLLGGLSNVDDQINSDIWSFDLDTLIWEKEAANVQIYDTILLPTHYYDSDSNVVVGIGVTDYRSADFHIFKLDIDGLGQKKSTGVVVDLGLPLTTQILLFLGLGILLAASILLLVVIKIKQSINNQ